MPKVTVAGHPVHPQLIVAPGALLPFSLVMDAMYLSTGEETYADAAYYTMVGGFVGGLAAAAAGAADYLEIPNRSRSKRIANIHALLNVTMLSAYGLNLLLRRGRRPRTGTVPVLLSVAGSLGVLTSSWYGGHLVYEHGLRVKGSSPLEGAPEAKLPRDENVVDAFETPENIVPETGPTLGETDHGAES